MITDRLITQTYSDLRATCGGVREDCYGQHYVNYRSMWSVLGRKLFYRKTFNPLGSGEYASACSVVMSIR